MSTGLVIPSYAHGFARNAAEAAYPHLHEDLVVTCFPFLGPSGLKVYDPISGYQNHATLTNMDPATDWVPTPYGWALAFDGNNDYVRIPYSNSVDYFSFVLLCKWNQPPSGSTEIVLSRQDGTGIGRSWLYHLAPAVKLATYIGGGDVVLVDSPTAGDWHHYVFVYDNGTYRFYVDGEQVSTGWTWGDEEDATGDFVLAVHKALTYAAPISMAQFAFYERPLATADIRLLYADPHAIARLAEPAAFDLSRYSPPPHIFDVKGASQWP